METTLKIIQFIPGKTREFAVLETGEVWDRIKVKGKWSEWKFYLRLVNKQ